MDYRSRYQVLAPDSVAWHIQAALVADRTGNVAARDLALEEAKRIAEERRLVEQPAPAGSRVLRYDVAHECNGVRLADIERQLEELGKIIASLHEHQVLDARWVSKLESKLTETRERFGDLERDVAAAVLELRKRVEELDRPLRATDGSA